MNFVVEHLIVSELSKEPLDFKDTIEKSANYEFIVSKHDYKAASSNLYIVGQSYVDVPTNPLDVTPVSDDEREDLEINGTLLLGQVRSCLLLSINCVLNKYNHSSLDQLNHPMIDHYMHLLPSYKHHKLIVHCTFRHNMYVQTVWKGVHCQ